MAAISLLVRCGMATLHTWSNVHERDGTGGMDPVASTLKTLLELDFCAGFFQFLLHFLGLRFRNAFLNGAGSIVYQLLGLLQTESRDGADLFDHRDLVASKALQKHVELGFFFHCSSGAVATGRTGNCDRRGGRLDAILLFEKIGQFVGLRDGEPNELFSEFFDISHRICDLSRRGLCLELIEAALLFTDCGLLFRRQRALRRPFLQ